MNPNRWKLITCLTTLMILSCALAAVAAPENTEEAPGTPSFTPHPSTSALDDPAPDALQTPAESPVAKSSEALGGDLFQNLACTEVCGPGGTATATASNTTCPKARTACFNRAADLVDCPDGEVCNEAFSQISCVTKNNGRRRVTCRVVWDCTQLICP